MIDSRGNQIEVGDTVTDGDRALTVAAVDGRSIRLLAVAQAETFTNPIRTAEPTRADAFLSFDQRSFISAGWTKRGGR